MKQDRMTRVNELLRREIAMALFHIMRENEFDLAAVTVTRVVTSPNLRNARVFISILEHQKDREKMIGLLKQHRAELQSVINKNVKLKYTPRLSFALDTSIEEGDRVLNVLLKLEDEEGAGDDAAPDTPAAEEPKA